MKYIVITVPLNEISHRLILQTIRTYADKTENLNYKHIATNLPTALQHNVPLFLI
jgi:hypothetical protein